MQKPLDMGRVVRPADIEVNKTYYLQRLNPSFTKVSVTEIRKWPADKSRTFYEIDFVAIDSKEKNWTNTNELPNGEYDEESLLTNKFYSVDPAPLGEKAA